MASISLLSPLAKRLQGKVALITGGASGIGACTARLFAMHGAKVTVADVQDDKGRALCSDLGASYVHCDVTDEAQVGRAVDAAADFGGGLLNILFSNAGTVGAACLKLLDSQKADFEHVLGVNLVGSYLAAKHAARVMIPRRSGSIVVTASVASVEPGMTPAAYTASKHGVVGLMRSAAVELGQFGVRVNCVSPYALATPLAEKAFDMEAEELEVFMEAHAVLKGARLKAEDVANAALFLASEESKYVSGLNLVVDGAFSTINPSHGFFNYAFRSD